MNRTHKPRELKPSFIVRPRRQFIDEGGRAKFKTSFDGAPEPSVTWKKDEKVLENSDKYKIYEKNSFCFLEVLSVTPDDNGDYTVIISNSLGSAEVSAELEVFSKPKPRTPSSLTSRIEPSFDKELTDITTAEGSTLKLECLLKGHPKPFIQWYFNGKMLRRSHGAKESFDGTSATLTIKDVCQKHGGQYECLASNILGEVRTACIITVKASSQPPDEMKQTSQNQQEITETSSESLHEQEMSETKKEIDLEKESEMEAKRMSDFEKRTLEKVETVTQKAVHVEEEKNDTEKEALKREVDLTEKKSASHLIRNEIPESEDLEAVAHSTQGTLRNDISGDTEKELSLTGKRTVKGKEQELNREDKGQCNEKDMVSINTEVLSQDKGHSVESKEQLHQVLSDEKNQPAPEKSHTKMGSQLNDDKDQLVKAGYQSEVQKEPMTEGMGELFGGKTHPTEEKDLSETESKMVVKESSQPPAAGEAALKEKDEAALNEKGEAIVKSELLPKEKDQLVEVCHQLDKGKSKLAEEEHKVAEGKHKVAEEKHKVVEEKHKVAEEKHKVAEEKHKVAEEKHKVAEEKHKVAEEKHKVAEEKHQLAEENGPVGAGKEQPIVEEESVTKKREELEMNTGSSAAAVKIEMAANDEKEEPFHTSELSSVKQSVTEKGTSETVTHSEEITTQIITDSKSKSPADSDQHEVAAELDLKPVSPGNITETLQKSETAASVDVEKTLAVSTPLENKNVREGDDAILECEISGLSMLTKLLGSESELNIKWLKDDKELLPSDDLTMDVSGDRILLEIRNTEKERCGEYMCVVRHGTIRVWTSCVLSIQPAVGEADRPADEEKENQSELITKTTGEPPSFVKPLDDLEVNDGDWVELEVKVKEPHGEGTSPFAKVTRRKHISASPTAEQHAVGGQTLEQRTELVAIEETLEKQSTDSSVSTSDKKPVEVSPDASKQHPTKHSDLADSPFVRAKKTLGSDVSRAVRTDNTPRVNAAARTGSRFARSKQMFESPKETKLEKKIEVPVRKLKQKFEFTEVRKKSPQTQVEHQWKRSLKGLKTAEDWTSKEQVRRKFESPLNGVDSSASSKESSVESHKSAESASESSPVVKETSFSVPSSPPVVSPCTERVVPVITKPDPPTIKVQGSPVSPPISSHLPMVEIILPADLIQQNTQSLQVSENNNNNSGALDLDEKLKPATRTEESQNRFVSSVNFGTIGRVTAQTPSTSTIEIVPLITSSGQEVVEPTDSHGIIVRSQQNASDTGSPITASGHAINTKPTVTEPEKHEVSSLVIETNSSVPAYKAIDFTIDLAANQVINVTPERNDQSSTAGSEFSLVDAHGIAVVGQPVRAVDTLTNQALEVKPRSSHDETVKRLAVSQAVVPEETSYSDQPVTASDTMTSQHISQTKLLVSSSHQNVTMADPESFAEKPFNNNNDVKATSFSDVRNKFERSPKQGKLDGGIQDKHLMAQQKTSGKLDNSVCDSGKPSFIHRPKSVNVKEGGSAVFTAEVKGQPMPTVEWQRNGSALSEDERIKFTQLENTHTFEINQVRSTDAGRYTCMISNSEGTEKCSVSLVVKQIENTEVTDFRGVLKTRPQQKMFHVTSNLNKFSPSKPVGGEQRDFRSVLRRHASAHEQPKFLTTLRSVEVSEGDMVKLQVKVIGTPHPKVTWCHDNEEIKASQYLKMSYSPVSHAAELVIAEAFQQDAGVYLCKAENEAGYAETSCSVTVKETKPGVTSLNGTPAVPASHDQAEPSPESETSHKVTTLVKSGSSQFPSDVMTTCQQPNASMQISPVVDDGQVERSLAAEVNVNPEASRAFADIPREGVTHVEKVISASDSLDTGNSHESCFTEEEPPMIVNLLPQSLNVLIGSDIELRGSFIGTPQPAVKWFVEECRTRTELLPDDRVKITTMDRSSVLFIANAREADTGIYTLEISNHLGFNQLSSSVTIEDKPDPPVSQPFISNIRNNSLILSWYGASYDGGSPILSYMVEMRKENQSDWTVLSDSVQHTSYAVSDLEPNVGYEFRVRAGNRHGFGEPSKSSDIVFTMEKQPTDVEETTPATVVQPDELPFEPRVVEVKKDEKFEDSYYLGDQIGRGKFGCVYKCTDKLTGRQFAAKFIKAARVSQKADVKQEVSVMNELHHPKLLLLWDAFESKKEIVLVMEHIGGGELLSRVVDEDYVLTERECVHFMRQICDGVKFIHEQNIVHLDLKPENVMCITKNSNEIKIIDFGLARKLDLNKDNKVMFGTAEFVAPEVVNYDAIGTGTDMWSVGVICYILLSGLSPFAGESDAETFSNVTMAQYDFDEEEFEEISDDAKDFINKLLQRERKKRMSARECLKHIWLAQDVKYMKAKRLSTEKHKRFLNRIKWRKAKFAVEMINRMQKVMSLSGFGRSLSRSSTTSSQSRSINGSSSHSRTGSDISDGCCSLSGDKPPNDVTEIEEASNMNNNNNSTSGLHSILNGE